MNRRSFLAAISALPLLGLLKVGTEIEYNHISEERNPDGGLKFWFGPCKNCDEVNWHRTTEPCSVCGKSLLWKDVKVDKIISLSS